MAWEVLVKVAFARKLLKAPMIYRLHSLAKGLVISQADSKKKFSWPVVYCGLNVSNLM